MLVSTSDLSSNSRVWIYQADRALTSDEQSIITSASNAFLKQWAAHGADLKAAAEIRFNHFLIIAADESFNQASGCSIDAQFRFVQELARDMNIDFFNRANLAFMIDEQVQLKDMKAIKSEISEGNVKAEDTFFDNTVKTIVELSTKWMVNANESWLKRYFPAVETV